jgi:hypothetical protein
MFGMKDLKDLNLKDLNKQLRNLDKDDLLELVGLQTRSSGAEWILPTIGAFSAGILVGAGIGLLMAPKPGHELRDDLRTRLQGTADQISSGIASSASSAVEKPSVPRPL